MLWLFSRRHHPVSSLPSPLPLSHHSQVKVLDGEDEYYKLLSAVESIPEEEYPTSTPPARSSGPPVSQGWASRPCQPVRQTHQTCRQTLQRASSVLDVLRRVERAQRPRRISNPFVVLPTVAPTISVITLLLSSTVSRVQMHFFFCTARKFNLVQILIHFRNCCEMVHKLMHHSIHWRLLLAPFSAIKGKASFIKKERKIKMKTSFSIDFYMCI